MLTLNKIHTGFTKDIKIKYGKKNWALNSIYNLNNLLLLYNLKEITSLYKDYNTLLASLNILDKEVNFKYMLEENIYKNKLLDIKNNLNYLISSQYSKYTDVIEKRIQFTQNFKEIYFNDILLHPGEYDHFTSQTGRVKIKNIKNNFLTMKKEERKNLKSTFINGRVYTIDIVSLEPRIYMHINNKKVNYDVYNQIKNELNIDEDRKNIKLAIISALYSGSINTIKKISGINKKQIKDIIEFLNIEYFKNQLEKQGENIKNYYDRPLKQNQALLNHYIQSTSADCAILGFYKLQQEWINKKINFCAFIHDAIIVDVHPDYFLEVENLKYIFEDIINIELPVKVERIS